MRTWTSLLLCLATLHIVAATPENRQHFRGSVDRDRWDGSGSQPCPENTPKKVRCYYGSLNATFYDPFPFRRFNGSFDGTDWGCEDSASGSGGTSAVNSTTTTSSAESSKAVAAVTTLTVAVSYFLA